MTAVDELIQTWLTNGMRKYHIETQRPVFAYCSQASGFFYNCFKEDYMENLGYAYSRKYFYNSESLRRARQAVKLAKETNTVSYTHLDVYKRQGNTAQLKLRRFTEILRPNFVVILR